MSISERLQMVIKMNGMTNASFADKIGVQRSSISHVLAGRNKPSIDFIQKILSTFPKVNAEWLITGQKVGKLSSEEPSDEQVSMRHKQEPQSHSQQSLAKDEETRVYAGRLINEETLNKNKSTISEKRKISKVIVFYSDMTFEEVFSIDQ